jgi:high-affinity K+ transport system ATPase subunit B
VLALSGRAVEASGDVDVLLRRNLLIYGLGGIIAPFIGIKLIDLVVHNVLGAWCLVLGAWCLVLDAIRGRIQQPKPED